MFAKGEALGGLTKSGLHPDKSTFGVVGELARGTNLGRISEQPGSGF